MGREIKFRALNVSPVGAWIATQGNHEEIDTLEKLVSLYGATELMQYTGMKDINGIDIYESDIVIIHGVLTSSPKYIGEVYWRDDRWFIRDKKGEDYDNGDFYNGDEVNWSSVEVIGNIYENKDLL